MRTKITVLLVALASARLAACGGSDFQGGGGKAGRGKAPLGDGDAVADATDGLVESFDVAAAHGTLDLVWVIDNSGSMEDKIAKVRQHFQTFMDSVRQRTDLKIILISQGASPDPYQYGIALPAGAAAQGHVQIDIGVGSQNGMAIAAAAACEASATGPVDQLRLRVCGREVQSQAADPYSSQYGDAYAQYGQAGYYGFESPEAVFAAAGQARRHFRDGAQRAYVFVTDDDSVPFGASDFAAAVKASDPAGASKVYAFRGLQASDYNSAYPVPGACIVSAVGVAYDQAASTLGGETFDICAADWRPAFEKLGTAVSELARNRFTLQTTGFAKVARVEVDGAAVPESAVTVTGQVVTIERGAMPPGARQVKIYLVKG